MPRAKNEYTAVATAKMRFAEILTEYGRVESTEQAARVINLLEQEGVSIEIKPRLKSVVVTIPIPEPAPEPKLGKFQPVEVPEDYDPFPGEEALSDWASQQHPDGPKGMGNDGLTDEEREAGVSPMFDPPVVIHG